MSELGSVIVRERLVEGFNVGGGVEGWCSLEQLEKLNLGVEAGHRFVRLLLGFPGQIRF